MAAVWSGVLLTLLTLIVIVFLVYRLRFFTEGGIPGRFAFLSGSMMALVATAWQILRSMGAYPEWFLPEVYPFLEVGQFVALVTGVLMMVVGLALYSDYWQTRQIELRQQEQKLSLASNLREYSRQPYQLLELCDIFLKELVATMEETAGAVFLINRSQRRFVLTASVGLNRDETVALEYYPLERNIVSQALDAGEPMIAGGIDFVDRSGKVFGSRFRSCLVLPMISGSDRVGGVILISERARHFGNSEIRYMAPVTDWLAEKLKAARVSRELAATRSDSEKRTEELTGLTSLMLTASTALTLADPVTGFCRSLLGMASAQSVHLVGLLNGSLHIYGGSEPLVDTTENYRTALIDAIDRGRPLIVNQEAANGEGRSFVTLSTLVYPCRAGGTTSAIILRRESEPFSVSETELKAVEVLAHLADAVINLADSNRLSVTRRRGFNRILELLRPDVDLNFEISPGFLAGHLDDILPSGTKAITFSRGANGTLQAVAGLHVGKDIVSAFDILPGEGDIGQAGEMSAPVFYRGRKQIGSRIQSYEGDNRELFHRLFGEEGLPSFMAICPIAGGGGARGVLVVLMYEVNDSQATEWERLLTLAVGLYTVRSTIDSLSNGTAATDIDSDERQILARTVNELNNRLSAVIGNAELARDRQDVSGDVRDHVQSIIREAEMAAVFVREKLGGIVSESLPQRGPDKRGLDEISKEALKQYRISGDLYLLEGRTFEIDFNLTATGTVALKSSVGQQLIGEAVAAFAANVRENEIISVSTYTAEDSAFLDISRHLKNFPPVEQVAGFGQYADVEETLNYRPADTFLKRLTGTGSSYAFDRFSQVPSYISFRIPLQGTPSTPVAEKTAGKRVLAIDDQTVILDLIVAMCQSQGYQIQTANSGEEGLELATAGEFDVILTDLAMPGMSGLEVARRIRRLHPQTPIILVTGWEAGIEQAQLDQAGIREVIYKPFRIEQLTDVMRAVLHKGSTL